MLVRYRMTANTTYGDMVSDVFKIVSGTASNVAQLSANTDQNNTLFFGTYPSSNFSVANTASNTFAKIHSTVNTYTHHIRLNWNSSTRKLATISLAQSYTSGTDTLVNSSTLAIDAGVVNYSTTNLGIDIIVSPQMLYFGQGGNAQGGVFDIGHSGVTRTFANSMLMMTQDMKNSIAYLNNTGGTIPYTYNFDTLAYGSVTTSHIAQIPLRKVNSTGNLSIFENPVFVTSATQGSTVNVVYGLYKLPTSSYAGAQTYIDSQGLRRLTINDYSLLTY